MALTKAQKKETDRLSAERVAEIDLTKLEKYSEAQLKAKVNILSVGAEVTFSPENNYSAEDRELIEAVNPRSKWMIAVPKLIEDANILRAEGMSETALTLVLKNN